MTVTLKVTERADQQISRSTDHDIAADHSTGLVQANFGK
jgi:hypothetical protein